VRIMLRQVSMVLITTAVLDILDKATELNMTAPFIPVPAVVSKHARPRFVTRHNFAFD
jgi:hypothetical protein